MSLPNQQRPEQNKLWGGGGCGWNEAVGCTDDGFHESMGEDREKNKRGGVAEVLKSHAACERRIALGMRGECYLGARGQSTICIVRKDSQNLIQAMDTARALVTEVQRLSDAV